MFLHSGLLIGCDEKNPDYAIFAGPKKIEHRSNGLSEPACAPHGMQLSMK